MCFFFLTGLSSEIPEDLYCLIKKAVSVRKHLERNRKDCDAKFRLILIESRVHRCSFLSPIRMYFTEGGCVVCVRKSGREKREEVLECTEELECTCDREPVCVREKAARRERASERERECTRNKAG